MIGSSAARGGDRAAHPLHHGGGVRHFFYASWGLSLILSAGACMVGEDEATDATAGASVGVERSLKGCKGKASSAIPDDGRYVITDRKSTRLNSSHIQKSRMPSSA